MQWERLVNLLRGLGHRVEQIDPGPACPTWCSPPTGRPWWTARCCRRGFATRSGPPKGPATRTGSADMATRSPPSTSTRARVTACSPTAHPGRHRLPHRPAAHAEVAGSSACRCTRLTLVDPWFYHLDTALAVLGRRRDHVLPGRVLPAEPAALRELLPGRDPWPRLRCRGVRAERGLRRPTRAAGRQASHLIERAVGARVRPDRRRPLRAAQVRRQRQVLHPGTARHVRRSDDRADRLQRAAVPARRRNPAEDGRVATYRQGVRCSGASSPAAGLAAAR